MPVINGYATLFEVKKEMDNIYIDNIVSFADNGSGGTKVTMENFIGIAATNSNIQPGQFLIIEGTTNYNGGWQISNVTKVTFDINTPFVGNDATGTVTNTKEFDSTIEQKINAMSRAIDDDRGGKRFYVVSETRVFTTGSPTLINVDDFISISELKTDCDFDGVFETTWDATDYILLPDNAQLNGDPYEQIAVRPNSSKRFPVPAASASQYYYGNGGYYLNGSELNHQLVSSRLRTGYVAPIATVKITGEFGHCDIADVPPPIKSACILGVARLFRRKDAVFGVLGANELRQVVAIPSVMSDPDIRDLLDSVGKRMIHDIPGVYF